MAYARRMVALNDDTVSRLFDPVPESQIALGVTHDIVHPGIRRLRTLQENVAAAPDHSRVDKQLVVETEGGRLIEATVFDDLAVYVWIALTEQPHLARIDDRAALPILAYQRIKFDSSTNSTGPLQAVFSDLLRRAFSACDSSVSRWLRADRTLRSSALARLQLGLRCVIGKKMQ